MLFSYKLPIVEYLLKMFKDKSVLTWVFKKIFELGLFSQVRVHINW